jgi:hypothetical protein
MQPGRNHIPPLLAFYTIHLGDTMELLNKTQEFGIDMQEDIVLSQALFASSNATASVITGKVLNHWRPVTFYLDLL